MRNHPVKHPLAPDAPLTPIPDVLAGQKFFNANFTGANLSKRDLRRATFIRCTFDFADLSEADCSGAEFHGSTFRSTNCRRTNFKDAKLHSTVFEPCDFFGMTMTFACDTYQDMRIGRAVWDGYLFFALGQMLPPPDDDGFDPRHDLIEAMGRDYYVEMFNRFKQRTL